MKNPMCRQSDFAVIRGGIPLNGTVRISGSKHSALHILGAALLAEGDVVIEHLPAIGDVANFLQIYESLNVPCRKQHDTAILSVNPTRIRFSDRQLHRVPRLRSSALLLGSFLLRNGCIRMPLPGGDRIDPDGKRGIEEFLAVLAMFGIPCQRGNGWIEARIESRLQGNRVLDLGNKIDFWFPTGNSRTALAMILAAGNRGSTTLQSALQAAEIQQLGAFLRMLGVRVDGLGTATLQIESAGLGNIGSAGARFALWPDKCEMAFWIVAACLTCGDIVLRFPESCSHYTVEEFGPLYAIQDSILAKMNVPIQKISPCEFRIRGAGARFRSMDLILDHLETEFNGKVMDASPYFIPLMCLAEGTSRYQDGKFGKPRVLFCNEINRLGARITIDAEGIATIRGGATLHGDRIWCAAQEIRGAGALLLAMLATPGENRLQGMDAIRRANEYEDKLARLGAQIHPIQECSRSALAAAATHRITGITQLECGKIGVDFAGRPPLVFSEEVSVEEIFLAAFLHPDLKGAGSLSALAAKICNPQTHDVTLLSTGVDRLGIEVLFRDGNSLIRSIAMDRSAVISPSGIKEYLGIEIGQKSYFAGRCLNPVPFRNWADRVEDILSSSPEQLHIPLTVTVGITDRCNRECEYCFARDRKKEYELDGKALLDFLDQAADAGVRGLRFVGGGEATLHPDFIKAALLAKARGLATFLITNGATLNQDARLLAHCIDSLRVSLNCPDPGNELDPSVLEGMHAVRAAGTEILLGASAVITPQNIGNIFPWAAEAKESGAAYILFKKPHGMVLTDSQQAAIAENLRRAADILESISFRIIPDLFEYEAPDLDPGYYQGKAGCLLNRLRTVIEANGDVLTCQRKGNGNAAIIGNIHQSSFLEIMTGDARRAAHAARAQSGKVCPDCLFKDAHLLLSALVKSRHSLRIKN